MPEPTTTTATPAAAAPSAPAPAEAPASPEASSALGAALATPPPTEPTKAPAAPPAEAAPADKKDAPALELKAPEGFKDTAAVEGIKALATELGLDSPKAQKVLEKFAGWQAAQAKAAEETFAQQEKAWVEALQKDPELGGAKHAKPGEQPALLSPAAQRDVGRAVQHFKAQGAMRLLHSAGLGNHPELVRLMASIGRSLREDSVAGTSAAPAPSERLPDHVLFYGPTTNPAPKEQ